MPFFQYTATNSQGQPIQGSVQAGSLDEANRALSLQGYRVSQIHDARQAAAAPPTVAPAAQPSLRPTRPEYASTPAPTRVNMPAPKPQLQPKKTRWGSDRETYFYFSQIAGYLKTGINPSQTFHDVALRCRRTDYKEAFNLVSKNVMEGGTIADTLELYPYLFAPHVVGAVRAGEVGGYLPEACETVSAQADASRRYRRWFVWLGLTALSVIVCYPILKIVFDGTLRTWDRQEESGGTAPGGATFMHEMGVVFKLVAPWTLLATIIFIIVAFIWQSIKLRSWRHRLTLFTPGVRKRAQSESFSSFAWNLSNLAHTGIPPNRAWSLATATVPNLAIRESLETEGGKMTEHTKFSEALYNTRMLPEEYAPLVQTGEVTGDVPGQLMQAAKMSQDEFQLQDKASKARVGCWIAILAFGVGMLLIYAMYGGFWQALIPKVIGD